MDRRGLPDSLFGHPNETRSPFTRLAAVVPEDETMLPELRNSNKKQLVLIFMLSFQTHERSLSNQNH